MALTLPKLVPDCSLYTYSLKSTGMQTHKSGPKTSSKGFLNMSQASETTTVSSSEKTTPYSSESYPDYSPPGKLQKINKEYSERSAVGRSSSTSPPEKTKDSKTKLHNEQI